MRMSLKLTLLSFALLLFGLAFARDIFSLTLHFIPFSWRLAIGLGLFTGVAVSIFPVAGIVVALVGFYWRDAVHTRIGQRLILLGIAILLFGWDFSTTIEPSLLTGISHTPFGGFTFLQLQPVLAAIFPVIGVGATVVGAFWRGKRMEIAP